ncbi:MAG: bifunctional precorrin-2 dehydrogenase/sirohydrochlorin ferrochelatase [Oscillospiraceae bacterium]|nr:bifunctional precorrin-2 dehydrogenase/sirohydrochlorin ferrochelatase [Oscillospiraceae bacterium]
MHKFPLFVSLEGRKALVFGGGAVGLRRAGALAQYGASVTVVTPEPDAALSLLPVRVEARAYRPGEIRQVFLVVAATDDPAVNAAITREARRAGALANNAGDHRDCDFFFPAVVRTEELSIGVTGNGENHEAVLGAAQKIRRMEF